MRTALVARALAGLLAFVVTSSLTLADEGMWTFDNPPYQQLKDRYGFEPTKEWLEHLRLSSVRFNDGGSGSFVSSTGLVLTNHHVARHQLQKLSSAEHDYASFGYLAQKPEEELACPDLELNVLVGMENVTERVIGATTAAGADQVAALKARKAELAKITKESKDATGEDCQVVTLYNGGEYWLYRYRKFTDVRVVFAPEVAIAYFGGDPDNFTYPRFDLDMALFRVYVDGKPYHPEHWLKWNKDGAQDGDLVFVSGHPGSTARLRTLTQLEMLRDVDQPAQIDRLNRLASALERYGARGAEEKRQASEMMFGISNSLKARGGQLAGLRDRMVMGTKAKEEAEFRSRVDANPEWKELYGGAWDEIAAAEKTRLSRFQETRFWTLPRAQSPLANAALRIVQMVADVKKPDGERLPGNHESELESTRFALFSPAPIYPAMDEAVLADWFAYIKENLQPSDRFVAACLEGKEPAEAAHWLIANTKLTDAAERKRLVEGGEAAVAESKDPMIALARRIDPLIRELRKWTDDNVDSKLTAAGQKIGKARFAVYGKSVSPDATFTLRLSYGEVKGYAMNGTVAPPRTSIMGTFARSLEFGGKPPFDLPQSWHDAKDKLDHAAPMNFVCTCDIIGGNSGSPVADRNGNIVGLVFDGNIESLVGDYIYDERSNRCVAVHAAAILEAMKKVYRGDALVGELLGKGEG